MPPTFSVWERYFCVAPVRKIQGSLHPRHSHATAQQWLQASLHSGQPERGLGPHSWARPLWAVSRWNTRWWFVPRDEQGAAGSACLSCLQKQKSKGVHPHPAVVTQPGQILFREHTWNVRGDTTRVESRGWYLLRMYQNLKLGKLWMK